MGLQLDPGGHVDPVTGLEGHGRREVADQTAVGDVVGATGHDVATDNHAAFAQLVVPCHQSLDVNDLALVGIHLLGKVTVPQGEVVVLDLNDGGFLVKGQGILDLVVLDVSVGIVVGNGGATGDAADDLVDLVLVDVVGGTGQHHHLAVHELIHHEGAHILVVGDEGSGLGKHHLLEDRPVGGEILVEGGEGPHAVVLDDNSVGLAPLGHGGEVFGGQILGILDQLQIAVLGGEGRDIQIVHALLALDDEGSIGGIELLTLHGFLDHVGLATLQKACEEVNGNFVCHSFSFFLVFYQPLPQGEVSRPRRDGEGCVEPLSPASRELSHRKSLGRGRAYWDQINPAPRRKAQTGRGYSG